MTHTLQENDTPRIHSSMADWGMPIPNEDDVLTHPLEDICSLSTQGSPPMPLPSTGVSTDFIADHTGMDLRRRLI